MSSPNGGHGCDRGACRTGTDSAGRAEAMIAAGVALNDATLRRRGLDLLAWLVDYETADRHLSPTPIAGRGPGDARPASAGVGANRHRTPTATAAHLTLQPLPMLWQ